MPGTKKLPLIVMGRRMHVGREKTITFELEADTGETIEVEFTLSGILSTVVLAQGWSILREELGQLPPRVARRPNDPMVE